MACWFYFHCNQQYVTTQQYCNALLAGFSVGRSICNGGSPTYWWPRHDHDDDNRSSYWRCSHYTTMILAHHKIFERTDDLAHWLANLTAERNHLNFRDCRSRSHHRHSNSPSSHDTANNFWPVTTDTKIKHNVAPSTAFSTCKTN
jgi:hypothetical protein